MARDRSGLVETPGGETFLRVYQPPARLLVVGAVHVAQALARMAGLAGLEVVVIDPRPAYATDQRFRGVKVVGAWPAEALAALGLDRRTAVVTLAHDPRIDDPALVAALRSGAFYVGALGSRRSHAARRERLRALGGMASGIAHDFNNSLVGILGLTELLLHRPENLEDAIAVVVPEADRGIGLAHQVDRHSVVR